MRRRLTSAVNRHRASELDEQSSRRAFCDAMNRIVLDAERGRAASVEDRREVEHLLKQNRFKRGFDGSRRHQTLRRFAITCTVALVLVVAVGIACVLVSFFVGLAGLILVQICLMIAVALAIASGTLWLVVSSSRTAKIGKKIMVNPFCVNCGYDLRGATPMIPTRDLGGAWIGPSLCSECGVCWPVVPRVLGGGWRATKAAPRSAPR